MKTGRPGWSKSLGFAVSVTAAVAVSFGIGYSADMADLRAMPGCVWVCGACGKTSPTRYGIKGASWGWDASCMMNSIHCSLEKRDGKWIAVDHPDEVSFCSVADASQPQAP